MQQSKKLQEFLYQTTTPELARMLLAIAEGCKAISSAVRNITVLNMTGALDSTNIQGETVQKLDDFSNQVLMDYARESAVCAGYLSEENDDIVTLDPQGDYILSVDPLDGSSNIDVVAPIGTIFSVYQRLSDKGAVNAADFLQPGVCTKAAGYAVYGSSTVFVFSTGAGVYVFSLSPDDNEFHLSHADLKLPEEGKIYSINQGNILKFEEAAQRFVAHATAQDKATSRPYSLRYIGSMVGDLHRTFLKGGVFLYPAAKGETKGKLRLLYECIPMSYLTEQAGGKSTDGRRRILDITPTELHERCAIVIGSKNMVALYESYSVEVSA
ncbi:MAG: class 1 fructose-bisphosphatase [Chitinophagales bacterium]